MSLVYCDDCNRNIDTDFEIDHNVLHRMVTDYANHNKMQKGGMKNE